MMYYDDLEYIEKMYGDDIISTPDKDSNSLEKMSENNESSSKEKIQKKSQENIKSDETNHSKDTKNKKKPDFENMN